MYIYIYIHMKDYKFYKYEDTLKYNNIFQDRR